MAAKEATKKRKAPASNADTAKKQKKLEKSIAQSAGNRSGVAVTEKPKASTLQKKQQSEAPKKAQKIKTTVKIQQPPVQVDEEESDLEDLAVADQTAELLKGFESSDDELEQGGAPVDPAPIPESDIPGVPASASSALEKRSADKANDAPATLYIGRVPHGFYEPQMRAYFSQFGELSHMRLSRNKRTGASKHYAFVEFSSGQVARIVADTMNNYLLFNHILKVKVLSEEQVASMGPALWAGEGKRFKVMPWGGIERGHLKSADRATWEKRVNKEEKRRSVRAAKLKELGYEFEAPAIAQVDSVPVQSGPEPAKALEAPENDASKSKKGKKAMQIEAPQQGKSEIDELIAAQKPAADNIPVAAATKKTSRTQDGAVIEETATAAKTAKGITKKTKKKVRSAA